MTKPGDLRFEPADPARTDLLMELMREFYACEHLDFDERLARRALDELLGSPSLGRVILAVANGEVAGYLILGFGFSLEFHGRDAFLDEIYLREAYRGRGIGKAALEFVEAACRREGIHALHLEVDRANERAQAVYRQAGYRDHDRYLLTKRLGRPDDG